MIKWDELSEQVSKIRPDKEKSKSLLEMIALREKSISIMKSSEMATLVIEAYYEIIKELITAIMSADGWKTVSHEMLIAYIAKFYSKDFSDEDLYVIDQLRKTRNDISYRGVIIKSDYLSRREDEVIKIIQKTKVIVQKKIK